MPEAKKATKKVTPKAEKKVTAKKVVKSAAKEKVAVTVAAPKKPEGLKVEVIDTAGKVVETMELPKEIFGAKINGILMSQAVRVYLANQRLGTASTKTRGEVDGSTRKIYRQKGTGRARHGGVRAPIFVKGGIAHGPKPQEHRLSLAKNMKKAALLSALTSRAKDGDIAVIAGLTKVDAKTKLMAKALAFVGYNKKKNTLLILPENNATVYNATRNLAGMMVTPASQLTTYDVLRVKKLVFLKETIEAMSKEKEKKNA